MTDANTDDMVEAGALLPCPFCGGTAMHGVVEQGGEANPDYGGHFIQCLNERCHGCMGLRFACGDDPRQPLVDSWNTRAVLSATVPALVAERDALAKRVGESLPMAVALEAIWNVRPSNWDDADDVEAVSAWRKVRDALSAYRVERGFEALANA